MLHIDLTSPPTHVELEAEKRRLLRHRKKLIKTSLLADCLHGFGFLVLYLLDLLSASGLVTVIVLATVVALTFTFRNKPAFQKTSQWALTIASIGAMAAIGFLLWYPLQQPLLGSIAAALISGSIVIGGAIFGSQLFQTLMNLENLKTFVEDERAQHELQWLCQEYPALFDYRQQSARNLRPNLTYLELKTMRAWADEQPAAYHQATTKPGE